MKKTSAFASVVTVLAVLAIAACSSSSSSTTGGGAGDADGGTGTPGTGTPGTTPGQVGADGLVTYGSAYEGGQFHLGPVDYTESQFHNACAPGSKYDPRVQMAEGTFLAGLWNGIPNVASYCDACVWITTAKGKSAMLRVVTYGDTTTNSIDTSPDAFAKLDSGEYPRTMTWQFARCPDSGPITYEFQTGSSEYWTSLWVRNARVPLQKVEVQSANHAAFTELTRGGDGTLTDSAGFGKGGFTIRSTGVDGSVVTETFDWPAAGVAGAFLTGTKNF
jgi:expansin (peptidoglycan-binding protein)